MQYFKKRVKVDSTCYLELTLFIDGHNKEIAKAILCSKKEIKDTHLIFTRGEWIYELTYIRKDCFINKEHHYSCQCTMTGVNLTAKL